MIKLKKLAVAAATVVVLGSSGSANALELRASHQWPGGTGDIRDEMVHVGQQHRR